MEKQLRCKDCKWFSRYKGLTFCTPIYFARVGVNPGQFACKKFVYKDK